MTTKSKSKSKSNTKTTSAPKKMEYEVFDAVLASLRAAMPSAVDRRKELLAQVAGAVAAGLVTAPSPSISKPESMATVAVDIAEEILKKAGIPSGESSAESSAPSASVGAAS